MLSRIHSDEMIAGVLNRAKLQTAQGNYWTRALIASLRCHHEIQCYDAGRQVAEGWLNLSQAARLAGIANRTLRVGIERDEVAAERPIACGPWVLNKESLQTASAMRYIERVRIGRSNPTVRSSAQATLELSIE